MLRNQKFSFIQVENTAHASLRILILPFDTVKQLYEVFYYINLSRNATEIMYAWGVVFIIIKDEYSYVILRYLAKFE